MQVQGLEKGFVEKITMQIDRVDENQLQIWESQVRQFNRWVTLGVFVSCQTAKTNGFGCLKTLAQVSSDKRSWKNFC